MEQVLHSDLRHEVRTPWLLVVVAACAALLPAFTSPAAAQVQMMMPPAEQLTFDRPESWALAYFTSATLLSGLETPAARKPGDLSIGLELGWLPSLNAAQRRVGYNGIEEQDLNKAPFMPRPRVTIGLPARFSLIVAAIPPVPMFGLKTSLVAIGLERPIVETPRWAVGLRGYGQIGRSQGSYTCPPRVLAFQPGSSANDGGCQAPSSDVASLRYLGGEASIAYRTEAEHRLSPHAAIGVSYMDVAFQVDALTFGYLDHTRYLSHGTAISGSGGMSYGLTSRFMLGVDVFYSPLTVRRGFAAPLQTDGFFNVRALVTYRLR